MLSIAPVNAGQAMSSYYDTDDYYAKDDPEAQRASQWQGKGAELAGLHGPVQPSDFRRVLEGQTPGSGQLGRMVDGKNEHRAGLDLTFSAPKSVSIMALVAGDSRLTDAHDAAVKAVVDHIEEKVLTARVWNPETGRQDKQLDQKMVAALFRHEVNRNQDPQLHTHTIIANMLNGADGKWRSVSNESLFNSKMDLGARYRAELAFAVTKLGYEVERTHIDGRFQIMGVPSDLMMDFSTRRTEIEQALDGYHTQNAKTAAKAALMTREHKTQVPRSELMTDWRERSKDYDVVALVPGGRGAVARAHVKSEVRYQRERDSAAARAAAHKQTPSLTGAPTNVSTRDYIHVPYDEHKTAKQLGAKWDTGKKSWYVPSGINAALFSSWRGKPIFGIDPNVRPHEQFATALRNHGLVLKDEPIMDGKWRRVPVEGDRGTVQSGSYRGFADGLPNGQMLNYKTGGDVEKWQLSAEHMTVPLSREASEELREQAAERNRKAEVELQAEYQTVSARAGELLQKASPAPDTHPYLTARNVAGYGLTQDSGGRLLVPLVDGKGQLWNVQQISPDGTKRFLKDGRKQGNFHVIDPEGKLENATNFILAEGYATGASLHKATDMPVVVTFDAGNLGPVAETLRAMYPDKGIIIAADDDHKNKVNTGLVKAEAAAEVVAGVMIKPDFSAAEKGEGLTDFNDLANARGDASPAQLVRQAVAPSLALATAFESKEVEQADGLDQRHAQPDALMAVQDVSRFFAEPGDATPMNEVLHAASQDTKAGQDLALADQIIEQQDRERAPSPSGGRDEEQLVPDMAVADWSLTANEHELALEIVDYAVRHLSERSSVFKLGDLNTHALQHATGKVPPSAIDGALDQFKAEKRLITSKHESHQKEPWVTTLEGLKMEKETVQAMRATQNTILPFIKIPAINRALGDNTILNDGQKNAVQAMLSGRDRIIGVQGYAGVGKTTLLGSVNKIAQKNGYRVMGLAPSSSAVKTLGNETGIESVTLQKFLGQYAGYAEGRGTKAGKKEIQGEYKKTLIVLDESSLASSAQIRDMMRIVAVIRPARVIMLGDEKQLDAVDAGRSFGQLQDHGMKTVHVGEIVRQRNPELKQAVYSSLAGDIRTAFARLGDNIHEAKPPELRPGERPSKEDFDSALADKTFEVWNGLVPDIRAATGIAAPTNALRHEINARIQTQLLDEGRLSGNPHERQVLKSAQYTNAQKSRPENYLKGETVIFNRDDPRNGIKQGDIATIIGNDGKTRSVALRTEDGNEVIRTLGGKRAGGYMDILKTDNLILYKGDKVRFTRNDKANGIVNSDVAEVSHIDPDGRITFRKEDGQQLVLEKNDTALRFMDLAYASTVHSFQGQTVDHIIGVMHSEHPSLTHQKAFYVEISRARDSAILITDDRQKLGETLTKETGERVAALEALSSAMQQHKDLAPEHKDRVHGDPEMTGKEHDEPNVKTPDDSGRHPEDPGWQPDEFDLGEFDHGETEQGGMDNSHDLALEQERAL